MVRRLAGGRAGVWEVLLLDPSREMLQRAQRYEVRPPPPPPPPPGVRRCTDAFRRWL